MSIQNRSSDRSDESAETGKPTREEGPMEQAQEEAAKEREEEGGYQ